MNLTHYKLFYNIISGHNVTYLSEENEKVTITTKLLSAFAFLYSFFCCYEKVYLEILSESVIRFNHYYKEYITVEIRLSCGEHECSFTEKVAI